VSRHVGRVIGKVVIILMLSAALGGLVYAFFGPGGAWIAIIVVCVGLWVGLFAPPGFFVALGLGDSGEQKGRPGEDS
jgi:hypothetical protein